VIHQTKKVTSLIAAKPDSDSLISPFLWIDLIEKLDSRGNFAFPRWARDECLCHFYELLSCNKFWIAQKVTNFP
jgi:hypothetical protein